MLLHPFQKVTLTWACFSLLLTFFPVSLGWSQHAQHEPKPEQTPREVTSMPSMPEPVAEAPSNANAMSSMQGPMGKQLPIKTKLGALGWQFGKPMKFGLKLDFGGFLSEPKTVGGGIGGMLFLGPKSQFVVEILIRSHYVFDAPYKTMFETDLKLGYVVPLWTRTAVIFKAGFGYMGWFPPSASNDTPQNPVAPVHNYLSIPLEAALLFDLSPSLDLEVSPTVMPMFELGGNPNFSGGIFMGLIFHPPNLVRAGDASGSSQHH